MCVGGKEGEGGTNLEGKEVTSLIVHRGPGKEPSVFVGQPSHSFLARFAIPPPFLILGFK